MATHISIICISFFVTEAPFATAFLVLYRGQRLLFCYGFFGVVGVMVVVSASIGLEDAFFRVRPLELHLRSFQFLVLPGI